jgi:hypothetical protein
MFLLTESLLLCVLSANCDFLIGDLKEKNIFMNISSDSGKKLSEMHEMLKTSSADSATGRRQTSERFC